MVNMIAFKADPDIRRDYKAECRSSPPTTLDEAIECLSDVLRDAKRCEEIDEETHGGSGAKPDAMASLLAKQAALEAQVAALQAPADPNKNQRDGGRSRSRGGSAANGNKGASGSNTDAQGRPKEWREGMKLCRCKINGDKHPFHLCPVGGKTPQQRAAEATSAAAAAGAPPADAPTPAKLVLDEADKAAAAELAAQVEAFFESAQPAVESASAFVLKSAVGVPAVSTASGPAVTAKSSRASRRASSLLGEMANKWCVAPASGPAAWPSSGASPHANTPPVDSPVSADRACHGPASVGGGRCAGGCSECTGNEPRAGVCSASLAFPSTSWRGRSRLSTRAL